MNWHKSSYSSSGNCVEIAWHKSSYSGPENCVEVAHCDCRILVRDSKNPHNGTLTFTHTAWTAFLNGIKAGELTP